MIALRRRRTGSAVPAGFRHPKAAEAARKLIDLFYAGQAGGKLAFDSRIWKPAKAALKRDTGGKCAYCEAPTDVVAHGDVEHFRPKSAYWWLAYCFDNYLFSCQICNQSFKGDNFPVTGARAAAPAMPAAKPEGAVLEPLARSLALDAVVLTDAAVAALWAAEDAHLVNPYIEDPAPLLAWEVDPANKEIWLRAAGTPRAVRAVAAAEAFLGLNREELRRERYVNFEVLAAFRDILALPVPAEARAVAEREVRRLQAARQPFAGMLRWFAGQWGLPGPA